AVFFFREIIFQRPVVDADLAAAFAQAHPRHRRLTPARGPIIGFLGGFRHDPSPTDYLVSALRAFAPGGHAWARHRFSAWSSAAGPGDCAAPCAAPPPPESAPDV